MATIFQIARFSLRQRKRMVSTYIYALTYFAIAFLMVSAAGGAFSGIAVGMGDEKVFANSPVSLYHFITIGSYLGLLITAGIFGQAVYQDFETRSDALFFTTPISPRQYLLGRFLGALALSLLLLSMLALGAAVAVKMPFVERADFEIAPRGSYLWPYVIGVLPNLLFTGGLFFSMAALGRRMMPVYIAAVLLLIGYLVAGSLGTEIEHRFIAALVDPFGSRAASMVTEYWTPLERNTRLMPLTGALFYNRLIWSAAGLALFVVTTLRFSFTSDGQSSRSKKKGVAEAAVTAGQIEPVALDDRGRGQLWALTRIAFVETVKNIYFFIIALAGVLFVLVLAHDLGSIYGTNTYPLTYGVIEMTTGGFSLFGLILVTFYSGELVWRERDLGMDQLLDATPLPTWKPFVAKLLALGLMQLALGLLVVVLGIGIQTFKGYYRYELGLYGKYLAMNVFSGLLIVVLAVTVQSIVQHKYVGHLLMVLYYALSTFMSALGLEHHLYRYSDTPSFEYSDMNGFGEFWKPVLWFDAYWGCLAVLLAVAARLFWVRGVDQDLKSRWAHARNQFHGTIRMVAGGALLGFIGFGSFIFYNTNILNKYRDSHHEEVQQASYEKKYRHTLADPQPKITGVNIAIDLRPDDPSGRARGTLQLKNKNAVPVSTVWINLPDQAQISVLRVGTTDAKRQDAEIGLYRVMLAPPLAPGAETTLDFDIEYAARGFRNGGYATGIVANGTFLNSEVLPSLGYSEDAELSEEKVRKKYGLPPKEELPDLDDANARQVNELRQDSDFVTFEATLSTSPDQIAIAPGLLEKQWSENGRAYFKYRAERSILNFFNISSGRYSVRRDRWKDVALEIYYHPGHEYDLDAMMNGLKASLDYYTQAFGPYQAHVLRILEFPRYQQFAQSFPNTIPYSEGIGFVARVDPKSDEDVDYPFYVTAHEVGHQWWAHQAVPARVQGASLLVETMAQYSALMIMKHGRPVSQMKRFLKYELDRYLSGRAIATKTEKPLIRVESQAYIYYRKGSVVMYELQDLVGEAALNAQLHLLIERVGQKGPPYTTARDLLAAFTAATPAEMRYAIADLFETITLYENRALSATAQKSGETSYEVRVHLSAKKVRVGEGGVETEVPMNDFIDVGAVDEKGALIGSERRRIVSGQSDVVFMVPRKPYKAGIDPLDKLIDRKPDDNLIPVEIK